ncbi:carbohydrate-binding module family 18 protein [Karstenula rhodostoma CBS 690.94]|uniref:Carbohydrate-binding module family 18 protein n=1 Tax=Karstenula rhodostoma CBS 690.94 TaxID=1392251 RepID=A0A9P4PAM6_9PLEO|nr:carbohydrate-binding module family 18 protein [Karstenula rhodostoma CBS 690.94]
MAAPEHTLTSNTGSRVNAHDSIISAPPVPITKTEKTTQYDTITSYETTTTAHHTAYKFVPPVTATVTEYVGELYDQSFGDGYELGDVISAPTVITETKTFTLAVPGDDEKTITTELVNEWSIGQAISYVTTVTEYTSTTWVYEHTTSTIWVDAPEPTKQPVTKTIELEDGHGGPKEPETTHSRFHIIDLPTASTSQIHKPSRPHGSTPTHRPSPSPSTFETKASPQVAPRPKPSVSAGTWQGKLLNTTDGTCGSKGGQIAYSCAGNSRGSCCSTYGHCGSEPAHCGVGCQSAFGTCGSLSGGKNHPHSHGVVARSAAQENGTAAGNETAIANAIVAVVKGTPLAEITGDQRGCSKWLWFCTPTTSYDATNRDGVNKLGEKHEISSDSADITTSDEASDNALDTISDDNEASDETSDDEASDGTSDETTDDEASDETSDDEGDVTTDDEEEW